MALIHPLSAPAAPDCLDLFILPETQTGVLKSYVLELPPLSTQEGAPPQFNHTPQSGEYNDLNEMKICGSLTIKHADGSNLEAGELAVMVNNFMHSMIKQVDIKLGNTILSLPQQMYGYKALIKVSLTNTDACKKTQLGAQGFFKESAGHLDSTEITENTSLYNRSKLFELSKKVDFEGRLLEDCLGLTRLLLNNVNVSVKLILASPEFAIMASDPSKKYKYELSGLKLKMTMVTVSPGVILGHGEALKTINAMYPYMRVEMMTHSIPKGESNVNWFNAYSKSAPSRLIIGMVSAEGFNGSYDKNPYNFQNYDVGNISLVVNDTVVGGQPLTVNFDESKAGGRSYVNAYSQMFSATGREGNEFGNGIKISDFPNGFCLFCYNLEAFSQPGKYFNLVNTGHVRLTMRFNTQLKETVVMIVFSEHQDMFQVDAARNVICM